ncbi:putative nudix hydrolase YeaB [Minicystis rosea]|nr:putative nudix hydrolase YeaB [Minicystis rosea]
MHRAWRDYASAPVPPDLSYDLPSLGARLARLPLPVRSTEPIARAAVAAVLRDPGGGRDAEILFIRRAERDGDPWSGHMAFPGGRCDQADATLFVTALRETREEVGLDLEAHGNLLTELPELHAIAHGRRAGLLITPFVFALERDVPLVFSDGEVAEALWAPLGPLARKEGAETISYTLDGRTLELPSLRVDGRVVWGLTYRMLEMLFEALAR